MKPTLSVFNRKDKCIQAFNFNRMLKLIDYMFEMEFELFIGKNQAKKILKETLKNIN